MTEHIKIGDITPRIRYIADGIITNYGYSFPIFKETDIDIYFNDEIQSSGFTINGAGYSNGGTITFDTAPNENTIITIVRNLAIKRITDFQEGGAFRANAINDELDYQTSCIQQLSDSISRALVLPPYAADNVNMALPISKAGKALLWNENGDGLENSIEDFNTITSTISSSVDTVISARDETIAAKDIAINATENINFPNMVANTYLKAKSDASGYETKSIAEVTSDVNKGYLYGLPITYIDNSTIQIGVGECLSDDNSTILSITSNTNAVLSEASANTSYHLFLNTLGVLTFSTDIMGSEISGAKRRIASFKTDNSGNLINMFFERRGNRVYQSISNAILEFSATSSLPTTFTDLSLTVPSGLICKLYLFCNLVNNNNANQFILDKNSGLSININRVSINSEISQEVISAINSDINGKIQHRCDISNVTYNYDISLIAFEYEV